MPISDFDDSTFVAFIDISGFKEMMKQKEKAWRALDKFYNYGYRALRHQNPHSLIQVEGLFISDCGVLFARHRNSDANHFEGLMTLLEIVKRINHDMLSEEVMLTTSIAFGKFKYEDRIEFDGIEKNAVYGQAYVSAFLDNEAGKPKIRPGQCRILRDQIPSYLVEILQGSQENPNSLFRQKGDHYYFYWMVNKHDDIEFFDRQFNLANQLQYHGMLKALRGEELPDL